MRNFKFFIVLSWLCLVLSCKKEIRVSYQVDDFNITETKSQKIKAKNEAEYISILYTNLFQEAISPSILYQTQNVMYSIGDQDAAKEMLLSNYFNLPSILIPSTEDMHRNSEKFITETYKRFYLRQPSQAELYYFKNYIKSNPKLTVEMVYTAFAASDEYGFY